MSAKTVTCSDIRGVKTIVSVDDLSFRPSIYGVIVRDNTVLLARVLGVYDFPGGAVELGESMGEALIREVKEETGVDVRMGELLQFATNFFIHPLSKKPFHTLLFFYTAVYAGGDVSTEWFHDSDKQLQGEVAQWVPIEKVDTLTFVNPIDSPALIRAAISGKKLI